MLASFAIAMLMRRWLAMACALVAAIAMVWGMTGIALFAVHKLSGWLLPRCFGVGSGTKPRQRTPVSADDIRSQKPRDVRPLLERLSALGVGKGWKLKVTLPKRA